MFPMIIRVFVLLWLFANGPAAAQPRPNLIPQDWTQELSDPATKTRRFVSPDGKSSLVTRQAVAHWSALRAEMDRIAYRDGEQITYQRRGSSWIAVSGYRGDQIFYRKSNLACGGTRWHHIELLYPRTDKRRMDDAVTYIARGMTRYHDDCG